MLDPPARSMEAVVPLLRNTSPRRNPMIRMNLPVCRLLILLTQNAVPDHLCGGVGAPVAVEGQQ